MKKVRHTYKRPVLRFHEEKHRKDVDTDVHIPVPTCHLCHAPAEDVKRAGESLIISCALGHEVLRWSPPVFAPEPPTPEELAEQVPLDAAVSNAKLTTAQKTALAAAGAASIGTALWQLLHG